MLNMNAHIDDARHLLKEWKSAGPETRKEILEEVREIIDYAERGEDA